MGRPKSTPTVFEIWQAGARIVAVSESGGDAANLQPAAQALGAAAVLHEPFKLADLLAAIRRALDRPDGDGSG